MLKVKSRVPDVAFDSFDAASSFVDQLIHDKTFRRKLRAAGKASAAASQRAHRQTRRQGISSLVSDPILKKHLHEALSQVQAVRATRKRPEHKARNLIAVAAGVGTIIVATLKLRHALADKPSDETESS
jgi:uncharacterized membrane protein